MNYFTLPNMPDWVKDWWKGLDAPPKFDMATQEYMMLGHVSGTESFQLNVPTPFMPVTAVLASFDDSPGWTYNVAIPLPKLTAMYGVDHKQSSVTSITAKPLDFLTLSYTSQTQATPQMKFMTVQIVGVDIVSKFTTLNLQLTSTGAQSFGIMQNISSRWSSGIKLSNPPFPGASLLSVPPLGMLKPNFVVRYLGGGSHKKRWKFGPTLIDDDTLKTHGYHPDSPVKKPLPPGFVLEQKDVLVPDYAVFASISTSPEQKLAFTYVKNVSDKISLGTEFSYNPMDHRTTTEVRLSMNFFNTSMKTAINSDGVIISELKHPWGTLGNLVIRGTADFLASSWKKGYSFGIGWSS